MIDITNAVSAFTGWFSGFIFKLQDFSIKFGGVSISIYAFILTAILISFLFSVFWKGAKK